MARIRSNPSSALATLPRRSQLAIPSSGLLISWAMPAVRSPSERSLSERASRRSTIARSCARSCRSESTTTAAPSRRTATARRRRRPAGPASTGTTTLHPAAAVARSLLVAIQARLLMDTFGRAARVSARRFFAQALTLPMAFYSQRSAGEISARVDLNERVAETISSDLASLALHLFTASFFLVLMVRLEPRLALLVDAQGEEEMGGSV